MLQDKYEIDIMALGENIRRLRRDKQWTQSDLADKSGIRLGQVSKLERNEADPKLDTLRKLINALECTPNELLNDVNESSLDSRLEMVLERVQKLPEEKKEAILMVIDNYCIAEAMQGLMESESKSLFGMTRLAGKTEEMT